MPITLPLVVALSCALAVLSLFAGFYRLARPEGELEDRLEASVRREQAQRQAPRGGQVAGLLRRVSVNERLAGRISVQLAQADLPLTVNEYLLLQAGCAAAGLVGGWLALRSPLAGAGLALAGWQMPALYLSRRRTQRLHRFQDQLVDTVSLLASGVRAGVGLGQAMDMVRQEMPAPTCEEFGRVVREIGLGASLEEALDHLKKRMPGDDLSMLVTIIGVQSEVGGNLGATLDNIVKTIRERVRIRQDIQTLTAQQRGTAYILAGLPFAVGGLVMMVRPEYMNPILQPKWLWMPGLAVAMIAVAWVVMNKLADIKV